MTGRLCAAIGIVARIAALILAGLTWPLAAAAPMLHAYVGTYTGTPSAAGQRPAAGDYAHGRGIYLLDIDAATGAIAPPRLVAETRSPSWLVVDAARGLLYAANETGKAGAVSAFRIDRASRALTLLNTKPAGGSPVSLALHPSGKYLLVANYDGGSIAVLPIRADGALGDATDVRHLFDPAAPAQPPSPTMQKGDEPSLLHMVGLDRRGRFVIANDAAQDRVYVWTLDEATGKLVANDPPFFAAPRGSFPRHFAMSPDDRHFYNLSERDATVSVSDFAAAGRSARLSPVQRVSALPAGFGGARQASELLITREGRHLYAANRGHDTIAAFAAAGDGRLTYLGEEPTGGRFPRTLAFDPAERFIFSLNQRSDTITVFRIDAATGLPRSTGRSVEIPSPAAMVFVP